MRREGEEGVILLNVLLFVAIAASVVALMIASEDGALTRATRLREAARALAIVHGGEVSAITALRRDMVDAPDADHAGEAWGRVAQADTAIDGGRFDLTVADANGRFNVNAVMGGDLNAIATLGRIGASVGLPPATVAQAVALIRRYGPIADLTPLARAGLDPATVARLSALVTALPYDSRINLNAVGEPLLAILLDDPAAARRLIDQRRRRGYLTMGDLNDQSVTMPPGTGFTSDLYWVTARARIGDTAQRMTSLIARRRLPDGSARVVAIGRWLGANAAG